MTITRRRLLIGTAAGVGIVGLAGLGARGARELVPRLRKVATPGLPAGSPGPLPAGELRVLLAAAAALVTRPDRTGAGSADNPPEGRELAPYRRMFDARARDLPGYRELYARFARVVDRPTSFAALPIHRRREILSDLCPPGRLARLHTGFTDPDRTRFRLYVIREILDLYAATDAWRELGFGPPPGLPRGLAAYTRAPERAER